jgi:hypothetical protein
METESATLGFQIMPAEEMKSRSHKHQLTGEQGIATFQVPVLLI